MSALVQKELKLVLHPASIMLSLLGVLALVPNWPYAIILFYVCLGVFFLALNAREGRDMDFAFSLPVSRADMVRARVIVVVGLELMLVLIMFFSSLFRPLLGIENLYVGMPPNVAFFGFCLMALALFNLVFFPLYYRDASKVGWPFMIACVPMVLFCLLFEVAPYLVPGFRECLAMPGFDGLAPQFVVLAIGLIVFALASLSAATRASRVFEKTDV